MSYNLMTPSRRSAPSPSRSGMTSSLSAGTTWSSSRPLRSSSTSSSTSSLPPEVRGTGDWAAKTGDNLAHLPWQPVNLNVSAQRLFHHPPVYIYSYKVGKNTFSTNLAEYLAEYRHTENASEYSEGFFGAWWGT